MIRYLVRGLWARLGASLSLWILTVVGVALGVGSVVSIQIINQSSLAAFQGAVQAVSGDADLTVSSLTPGMPEGHYPRVLATPGVAAAWPLARFEVCVAAPEPRAPGQDACALFLEVVGADVFAPLRLPWEGEGGAGLEAALGTPGWVAVSPGLAAERGWTVGSRIRISAGDRFHELVLGALVDFQRLTPLASRKLAVMDIAQAQTLLGRPGELHQIDVVAAPGTAPGELAVRLGAALGPGVEVLTPGERKDKAAGLLSAFHLNLTALSLISLVVGTFLVYGATTASLVRRRKEIGILRILGATRLQTGLTVLAEVALVATLGAALGIGIGYLAAADRIALVSESLSNLYLTGEIERLVVPGWIPVLAVGIGLAGALAGALVPASEAAGQDLRALLAPATLHQRLADRSTGLALGGLAVLAAGGAWYAVIGHGLKPGGFGLAVAVLVAIPLVAPWLAHRLGDATPLDGFGFAFGLKGLAAELQATSLAASTLAITVSMMVGVTVMIESFRATVDVWIEGSIQADVYLTSESWRRAGTHATLDDALVASLRARPEVAAVDRLRRFFARVGARRIQLAGVDMAIPDGAVRFPLLPDSPADAFARVARGEGVLIGEPLARKEGLGPGARFEVAGPAGPVPVTVAGVFYDYTTEEGSVVMDLATLEARFGAAPINSMSLYAAPGVDPEALVDRLKEAYADRPLWIRSNRALRREILAIFDQTFAVTRILQAIALLTAVAGITLALVVLARERTSELALFRALGATRGQIFGVWLAKGAGIGMLGLGLGSVGGLGLAAILILVVNRAYFGWTIQASLPVGVVAVQGATILGAALAASVYPALRASRVPATELARE